MSTGLITRFLGQGLAASRPADPDVATDAIAFYWSTDTGEMSAWVEGAWVEDVFAGGGGGLADADYGDFTVSGGVATIDSNAVTTGKINNAAVTLAKIANAAANSRILGSGSSGSGAAYTEMSLSTVLDLVGSAAQGDILYRGSGGWTRLAAGTSGHYLKTQGAAADPTWSAPSGGKLALCDTGIGSASGSSFAFKGNTIIPNQNMTISAIGALITLVSGATYKAVIADLSSPTSTTPTLGSNVSSSGDIVPTDTNNQYLWFPFASPVSLTAGTGYLLMVGRTDSTSTYTLPVFAGSAVTCRPAFPGRTVYTGRVAATAPATGNSVDTNTGGIPSVAIAFEWSL